MTYSPVTDLIRTMNNRHVRDLTWCISGPDLYGNTNDSGFPSEIAPPAPDWFLELDQNPEPLLDWLERSDTKLLGSRFEALWHFYFLNHPDFSNQCLNLQVPGETRTLGEFDALLQIRDSTYWHLELCCKFYLYWKDASGTEMWLGPQGNDRFDLKYDRTHTHQLPLLKTTDGINAWQNALGDTAPSPEAFRQHAFWRGCLFYPLTEIKTVSFPEHAWRGFWATTDTFAATEDSSAEWVLLDKTEWLSPACIPVNEALSSDKQLLTTQQVSETARRHFSEKRYALKVARVVHDAHNQIMAEELRYMLVPDDWPYTDVADKAAIPLRPCNPPV